jgi:zinc D-Ala-D-Ala dipeptidase
MPENAAANEKRGSGGARIDAPAVVAVAAHECGEPLVDLRDCLPILISSEVNPPLDFGAGPPVFARAAVAERLRFAIQTLPAQVQCVVVSAFRSRRQQQRLYRSRLLSAMRSRDPDDRADIAAEVRQYVADPRIYAPHTTGGAIDVVLANADRVLLDMGGRFASDDSAHMNWAMASAGQRQNRAILCRAMQAAGFENYPLEWWHWSFGEKYWGYQTGREAIYATVPDRVAVSLAVMVRLRRLRPWRRGRGPR